MTKSASENLEKRILATLSGAAVLALLFATLWPFNPFLKNQVNWLEETDGVRLGKHGLLRSEFSLHAKAAVGTGPCSLEFVVRPVPKNPGDTILSIYRPENASQFLVRQWTDSLLVMEDLGKSDREPRTKKLDVDHAFQVDKSHLITFTSSASQTIVYLDGIRILTSNKFLIPLGTLLGEIVVGNSATDYEPWSGEFRGLAIYSKELAPASVSQHYANWMHGNVERTANAELDGLIARYNFSERSGSIIHNSTAGGPILMIPPHFSVPHKVFLQSPANEFEASWIYANDVLRNIAGFMPLGFILCSYFLATSVQRNAFFFATAAGGTLSFFIEVMQSYVPQRVSGWTDVITNTLGAGLGAMLLKSSFAKKKLNQLICLVSLKLTKARQVTD